RRRLARWQVRGRSGLAGLASLLVILFAGLPGVRAQPGRGALLTSLPGALPELGALATVAAALRPAAVDRRPDPHSPFAVRAAAVGRAPVPAPADRLPSAAAPRFRDRRDRV